MPTTRPRYTITDTGPVRDLLDDAQRQWPEVDDRKELLCAWRERDTTPCTWIEPRRRRRTGASVSARRL